MGHARGNKNALDMTLRVYSMREEIHEVTFSLPQHVALGFLCHARVGIQGLAKGNKFSAS